MWQKSFFCTLKSRANNHADAANNLVKRQKAPLFIAVSSLEREIALEAIRTGVQVKVLRIDAPGL